VAAAGGRGASWLGFRKKWRQLIYASELVPDGLLGVVPFDFMSCWPTLWAEVAAQHNPTSCSCRPRLEIIVLGSCLCRVKNSCFGQAMGLVLFDHL
jgi:hypothetical protein